LIRSIRGNIPQLGRLSSFLPGGLSNRSVSVNNFAPLFSATSFGLLSSPSHSIAWVDIYGWHGFIAPLAPSPIFDGLPPMIVFLKAINAAGGFFSHES
jgi:hypothetical protein